MEFRTLASSLAGLVDSRPLGPPPVAPSLPNEDVDEPGKQSLGFAEGQSFAIEYVDAAGRPSSRRITVYDIQMTSSGVPCLYARCHERGAMRSFRVDRIKYCIDYDGEVFDDVPAFLHENFGMTIQFRSAWADPPSRWDAFRNAIWADAVLLSAMSRVDHHVHRAETDTALAHFVWLIERDGTVLAPEETDRIWRYARRLRPDADTIGRALDAIGERPPEMIQRLLIAAAHVMDADGKRHAAEVELLNRLAEDLLGVRLFS